MERVGRPRKSDYYTLLLPFCFIILLVFFFCMFATNNKLTLSEEERNANLSRTFHNMLEELKQLSQKADLLEGRLKTEQILSMEALNEDRKFKMKMVMKKRRNFPGGIF